jgi:hypothetical protein
MQRTYHMMHCGKQSEKNWALEFLPEGSIQKLNVFFFHHQLKSIGWNHRFWQMCHGHGDGLPNWSDDRMDFEVRAQITLGRSLHLCQNATVTARLKRALENDVKTSDNLKLSAYRLNVLLITGQSSKFVDTILVHDITRPTGTPWTGGLVIEP